MNINLMEQQRNRKRNLKAIINHQFDGSVDAFASFLDKHKNFIYSLLWDVENPNNRKITDKMARLIEKHLQLQDGYLDKIDNSITDSYVSQNYIYIPYLDIIESENTAIERMSEEPSFPLLHSEILKKNLNSTDLVAVKTFDNSMVPYCDFEDTLVVDRSFTNLRSNQYYLIKYFNKLYIRKFEQEDGNSIFTVENNSLSNYKNINIQENKKQLTIIGIIVFRFLSSTKFMR